MRCFFFFVFLLIEVATDGIALAVAVLLSRPAFSVLLLSSLAAVEAAALSVPLPAAKSSSCCWEVSPALCFRFLVVVRLFFFFLLLFLLRV